MKKLYLLGALVLALTVAVFAKTTRTTIYEWPSGSIDIMESVDDANWTKKTTNVAFTHNGTAFRVFNNAGADCDSWLVSPSFEVTAGNQYEVSFEYNGTSTTEFTWNLYFSAETPLSDADAVKALTPVAIPTTNTSSPYTAFKHTFTAEADGKMYIAINNYGHFKGGVLMKDFNIDEIVTEEETEQPLEPEGPHDCAGVSTPYAASPATSSSQMTAGWTILNNNEDNRQWEAVSEASFPSKFGAKLTYTSSNGLDHDDYLYSPAVHLDRNKEYVVSYWLKAGSGNYKEKLAVYMSESKEPDDVKASHCVNDYGEFLMTTATKESFTFTPEKTGDYYLVFYAYSEKDKMNIFVGDVLISENIFAPAAVTSLTATPGEYRALTCALSWVLPTTDLFGATLPADKPITEVRVYRDDEEAPIANLGGDVTTFEDSESTNLTSGYHTYYVSVVADGVEGAKASVATSYVGPIAPFDLPKEFTFLTDEDFNMWDTHNGNMANSDLKWTYDSSNKVARFAFSGNKQADHYFITPPLKIEEAGYYRASWGAFTTEKTSVPTVEMFLINDLDFSAAEMSEIGDKWFVPYGTTSTTPTPTAVKDFRVTTPGTYYVATRITYDGSSTYANCFFRNFKIEKSQFVPATVTELTAEADENGANEIKLAWVNPEKDFAGLDMTADQYMVEIYLNDSETPAMTITDGSNEVSVTVAEAGIYTVTVKTVSTDGENTTAPVAPSVTTGWVGSRFVTLPYETEFKKDDTSLNIWNFIDANYSTYSTNYTFYHNTSLECLTLQRGSGVTYNDYVMSPKMHLTPGYYKLTLTHKGGSTTVSSSYTDYIWNPIIGLSTPVEEDSHTTPELVITLPTDVLDGTTFSVKEYAAIVHVETEGDYQVAYGISQYATQSPYESYMPQLHSFKFEETEAYPANVSDLTAAIDEDENTTVHLSWTNPTQVYGTEIELDAIESVVIERDGEVVGTVTDGLVAGEEAFFTDTEVPAGVHTYTVYCAINGKGHGVEDDYATVESPWVGNGLTAPVLHDKVFPGWTTHDANGDDQGSGIYGWNYVYNQKYQISGSNNTHDDYLISAPLNFEENVVYKVRFNHKPSGNGASKDYQVAVKAGTDADHTTFSTISNIEIKNEQDKWTYVDHVFYVMVGEDEAQEEQPAPAAVRARVEGADDVEELTFDDYKAMAVKIPAAGANRFALHVTDGDGLELRTFEFTEAAKKEIQTGLEAVEAGKVTFDGNGLCFSGVADVKVFNVAGACVADQTAHNGFSFEGFAAGYYIVKVTADGETTTLKVAVK